jgi:XTP/dITP diphosphohydrolase
MPPLSLRVVTSNHGKMKEFRAALGPLGIRAVRLATSYPEIQSSTFEEVARFGVEWLRARGLRDFVLEDSGLEVRALHGFPGVYSKNTLLTIGCRGILRLLRGARDRRARFVSVIGGCVGGRKFTVRGECQGAISPGARGSGGFGFDPIFIPQGNRKTFGEMSVPEKNAMSHRGRAIGELVKELGARSR